MGLIKIYINNLSPYHKAITNHTQIHKIMKIIMDMSTVHIVQVQTHINRIITKLTTIITIHQGNK